MLSGWNHLTFVSFSEAAIFTFQWSFHWGNKENQWNKTKQTLFLHLGLLPGLGFIQKGQSWTTTKNRFGPVSHHLSQAQTTAHWKPHGKKHPERFLLWRACLRHFSRQVPEDHPSLIAASLSLSRQTSQSHHEKAVLTIHCFTQKDFWKMGCSLIFWNFPQPQSV